MRCPTQSELLRLISGELAEDQADTLRSHVAHCPACTQSYQHLQSSWDALAAWRVDHGALDVFETVVQRAAESAGRVRPVRSAPWRSPMRLAASVMLAAGLGIGAGMLAPTSAWMAPSPSRERIAEALGLTHFAADSATGLPGSLEPALPNLGPEGGSP